MLLKYQLDQTPDSSSAWPAPDPSWLWDHHPDHAEQALYIYTGSRSIALGRSEGRSAMRRAGALQLLHSFTHPKEMPSKVPITGASIWINPAQKEKKKSYPRITLLKLSLIYYLIFTIVYHDLSKLSEVLGFKDLPATRTRWSPQVYQTVRAVVLCWFIFVLFSTSFCSPF